MSARIRPELDAQIARRTELVIQFRSLPAPCKGKQNPAHPRKWYRRCKAKLAMSAAVTLACRGPGLKRFCMDDRISIRPDACAPARPSADINFAGLSRMSPAATVARKLRRWAWYETRGYASLFDAMLARSITATRCHSGQELCRLKACNRKRDETPAG
jgi:hypothetical protein